ncbi:hypothetical protein OCA5_c02340 [Afipia carboxidovorans OM5]|uniref:Uncharacterized protein n=1 Tax=Afipia carboxidovorans (strain ATCC 49405 / DSM 1227 / KCTC 32145 / OM5) TaxID=504832 RepID=F8BST6_AFIC5|nr:hypothetical protein OCA4_c02340 [Afipia carboxidovorans OM4]AEI04963.1 hypothetical protein OCA5_c02340 [Afipia carboxidovorans OM5]
MHLTNHLPLCGMFSRKRLIVQPEMPPHRPKTPYFALAKYKPNGVRYDMNQISFLTPENRRWHMKYIENRHS